MPRYRGASTSRPPSKGQLRSQRQHGRSGCLIGLVEIALPARGEPQLERLRKIVGELEGREQPVPIGSVTFVLKQQIELEPPEPVGDLGTYEKSLRRDGRTGAKAGAASKRRQREVAHLHAGAVFPVRGDALRGLGRHAEALATYHR